MGDAGLTSEQRAAIAVHNATQNRMCLNLSGNGQICVACSEVADQIDAAVEVERQRSQEALAAARRATALYRGVIDNLLSVMEMQEKRESGEFHITGEVMWGIWSDAKSHARTALAAPAAGDSK